MVASLLQDLHHAIRRLRKAPGTLLRPLPYENREQLFMVWEKNPHFRWIENIIFRASFLDSDDKVASFACIDSNFRNLAGRNKTEEVPFERVTANIFFVPGVQPVHDVHVFPRRNLQAAPAGNKISGEIQISLANGFIEWRALCSWRTSRYNCFGRLLFLFLPSFQLWISGIRQFPRRA